MSGANHEFVHTSLTFTPGTIVPLYFANDVAGDTYGAAAGKVAGVVAKLVQDALTKGGESYEQLLTEASGARTGGEGAALQALQRLATDDSRRVAASAQSRLTNATQCVHARRSAENTTRRSIASPHSKR